ncbi:hypothetical protein J2W56_003991 [Nocardia kruczakiae]|uniref:Oxidoreductase n=1 Tax=Nocardia kruczakiae TaxID=261477 RepID=A0ABU1XI61_9NOCA|nr:hypothetical protein [Nocardia kruczakiae]MDR7170240.1 hypothetical protein [Nocardia kruczakiae]
MDRYAAVDLPRTTTAAGAALLLGLGGVHLYVLVREDALPTYLRVGFAILIAWCAGAAALVCGARTARAGWALGGLASLTFLVVYVLSRLAGLPGLPEVRGWWDSAPGSVAGTCALGFLAVTAAIVLGVTVARPQRQHWHD